MPLCALAPLREDLSESPRRRVKFLPRPKIRPKKRTRLVQLQPPPEKYFPCRYPLPGRDLRRERLLKVGKSVNDFLDAHGSRLDHCIH